MMEQFNNFNSKQLRINGRCPVCNSMYDFQRLQILGEKDQSILVYMQCQTCQTSVLSILSLDPRGMSAQGMVTDLTFEEVFDFEGRDSVCSDDVLALHQCLENEAPVDNFIN